MPKKKGEARVTITLACGDCRERNYTTEKNKKNDTERLSLSKFCSRCRKRTSHREVR